MIKISSGTTFMMKRVFPAFWFGIIGVVWLANLLGGVWLRVPAMLFVPPAMAAFGFFIMKALVWDLMDEVYDCGDHLLVRNGGDEESVRLADIVNVNSVAYVNPPRITLRLAVPGKFGVEVSFSPPRALFFKPFSASPIADDLIRRVEEARRVRYRAAR